MAIAGPELAADDIDPYSLAATRRALESALALTGKYKMINRAASNISVCPYLYRLVCVG